MNKSCLTRKFGCWKGQTFKVGKANCSITIITCPPGSPRSNPSPSHHCVGWVAADTKTKLSEMLAGFCDPSSNPFVSVHHCSESRQHWGSSAGHLVMVELGESDGGKAILTGWRHWNPQIPHGYYCPPCRTAQDNRNLEDLLRMQVRGCLSESGLYFLNCIFPKLEIVHLVFPK